MDLPTQLPPPPHLKLHVGAGQDDATELPFATLVLADDPEELALLAGFTYHLQRHPAAARGLVLELHAHWAPGQVDRRADEPPVLTLSPAITLQPQEIPVIWGNKPKQRSLINAWERHQFSAAAPPTPHEKGEPVLFFFLIPVLVPQALCPFLKASSEP